MVYSFSQIKLYKQCPLAYKYRYIDKLRLDKQEKTADLLLWTIVHSVLEKIYKDVNDLKNLDKKHYLDYYKELWEKEINSWDEINIKWDNKIEDYINRWNYYIDNYFDKHYPFNEVKVVSIEQIIHFSLWENIKFRWIIDRLDKVWDDFIINDYKTNKNLPTQDKDDYIDQLTLYWLGIKQKYDRYFKNIYWKLYFLHFDIVDEFLIDDAAIDKVVEKYSSTISEIENSRFNHNMWIKDVFLPNETPWCRFCEFKSLCPLFSHLSMDDENIEFSEKTIKWLIDEYWAISSEINKLGKQKDNIKSILTNYAVNKSLLRLYWDKYKLTVYEIKTFKILNEDMLLEILKSKWLLDFSIWIISSKVSALIKKWDLKISELDWIISEQNTPSLRQSNIN